MRIIRSAFARARERTMLEIERSRHQPRRGLAYAAVGAAAVVLFLCLYDASSMSMTTRPTIQRATTW